MRYSPLFRRGCKIIVEDGISTFTKKAVLWMIRNAGISHELTIIKLMYSGRSYNDSKWLLENKQDRQDALISQPSTWDTYHGPASRKSHRARYEFAAQKLDESFSSEQINVLDVASGTGYGSNILENKSDTYINHHGCEIDSSTIKYSGKYYPSEYIRGNVEHLPFKTQSFEGIVSLETMEHIPDLDKYFGELRRVSTEDSKLIISTPCDENLDLEIEAAKKEYPHRHSFDFEEINSVLREHFPDSDVEIYVQFKKLADKSRHVSTKVEKVSSSNINDGDYFLMSISR